MLYRIQHDGTFVAHQMQSCTGKEPARNWAVTALYGVNYLGGVGSVHANFVSQRPDRRRYAFGVEHDVEGALYVVTVHAINVVKVTIKPDARFGVKNRRMHTG